MPRTRARRRPRGRRRARGRRRVGRRRGRAGARHPGRGAGHPRRGAARGACGARPAVRRFGTAARVRRTTDLLAPDGPAAVLDAASELVAAGADTLLLACTGLNTIGARPLLEERLGVPVVDPVLAAGAMASYARTR
ncbi:aspartate/glutamate racemase family protein [Streptomyces sp. M19]